MYIPRNSSKYIYNLDFTTLANQDLLANQVIDGHTWTVTGGTGAFNSIGIVNGVGMVADVKPGNTFFENNDFTCGAMRIPVSSWIPGLGIQDINGFKLKIKYSLTNVVQNFQTLKIGFGPTGGMDTSHLVICDGYITNQRYIQSQANFFASSPTTRKDTAIATGSNNVLSVAYAPPWLGTFEYGEYGSLGFSTPFTFKNSFAQSGIASVKLSDIAIIFAFQPGNAASSFTVTITDIQVEQLVLNQI